MSRERGRENSWMVAFIVASIITVMIVLLLSELARAEDRWFSPLEKKDIAFMAVNTGLLFLDWGLTRDIAKNPEDYHEHNPILGDHPTIGRVNTYFVLAIPLYLLTAYALPKRQGSGIFKWVNRQNFNIVIGAGEGICVATNLSLGMRINF